MFTISYFLAPLTEKTVLSNMMLTSISTHSFISILRDVLFLEFSSDKVADLLFYRRVNNSIVWLYWQLTLHDCLTDWCNQSFNISSAVGYVEPNPIARQTVHLDNPCSFQTGHITLVFSFFQNVRETFWVIFS